MKFQKKCTFILMSLLFLASCDNSDDKKKTDDGNGNGSGESTIMGHTLTSDTTISGNVTIDGKLLVGPGATLTVAKGTIVKFVKKEKIEEVGALITLPGEGGKASGRLVAIGTADEPIIFTSDQPKGQRDFQDWGGIVLAGLGYANTATGTGDVEGLPAAQNVTYGGGANPKNDDDSGTLQYVRIEYCGAEVATDSEINGLTLYACGSATTIDHVQVYKNSDDGIEIFGGSVNLKYMISAYNDDDSFDLDQGWNGYGQFWLAVQNETGSGPDNGFESDGRKEWKTNGGTATHPKIYNVTLVGDNGSSPKSNRGLRLREDFEGEFRNFVIADFEGNTWKLDKNDTDGDDTYNNWDGQLTIDNAYFVNTNAGMHSGFASSSDSTRYLSATRVYSSSASGADVFENKAAYDFRLKISVLDVPSAAVAPTASFFSSASYIGAFGATNWATGNWVRWSDSDFDY